MKLPPTILIQEDNFHNAWARAVRYLLRDGLKITIGDAYEPKLTRDACVLVELTGDAIRQIEDRELHPQFPFKHIDPYCEEFTREYLSEYIEKPDQERFSYLYFERLAAYELRVDQLDRLRVDLGYQIDTSIASNRDQAITWIVETDCISQSPPCLQRIWIRHLGDQSVEVHLTWRSRDLYTAWQVNIVAIIDMLNREVIQIRCIFMRAMLRRRKVRLIPVSPQER